MSKVLTIQDSAFAADAELLTLFDAWERALAHANEPGDWPDEELNARCAATREIEDRIAKHRPETRQGALASLAFFRRYCKEIGAFQNEPDSSMAESLLDGATDVLARAS